MSQGTSPGLPPRAAAWRVLHDIRHEVPFDRALERALTGLPDADKRLTHELAAGVLRRRTPLDQAIAPHVTGGVGGVRDDLLDILRLGAYQLLYLERVPRHAAVDTAVTLGRRIAGARVGGFINAVLRKVAEQAPDAASRDPVAEAETPTADSLAIEYSHPAWLVDRWVGRFGLADTERLLRANNTHPPLVIQPARWSRDALIVGLDQQRIPWEPAPFDAGLVVTGRRPQELPGFTSGSCYVQDPAQALVVRYFDLPAGIRLFDACAAPGGKAMACSARAGFVVAGDLRAARTRRLRQNLERAAPGPAAVLAADALAPPVRPMDAILLDAPCLGTGAFARHPDARWRVSPAALAGLADQGRRLLAALAEAVRPGGLLFFSTCSLEPEENEVQIEAFLAGDARYRREPSSTVPPELLTPVGDLMLLPMRHGTDGAYAARLRRVG
ncbi:MAG TPA: transcription antitermination factor NusB [Gemmatimonadales bacterium]|nr:transcription antitermination factor NusB [Gemmatimonadales bacterium]